MNGTRDEAELVGINYLGGSCGVEIYAHIFLKLQLVFCNCLPTLTLSITAFRDSLIDQTPSEIFACICSSFLYLSAPPTTAYCGPFY